MSVVEIGHQIQKDRLNAVVAKRTDAVKLFKNRDGTNFPVLAPTGPYGGLKFSEHKSNGDEDGLGNPYTYAGNFAKGLEHDSNGIPVKAEFKKFRDTLRALAKNYKFPDPSALQKLDAVLASRPAGYRGFTNPLSGLAADSQGLDPIDITQPPAPNLDSDVAAKELVELYWMALLRDFPFGQWSSTPLVNDAIAELNALNNAGNPFAEHYEPAVGGGVVWSKNITIDRLFRGSADGNDHGFYVSQFLLKDVPFGSLIFPQKNQVASLNINYLTTWNEWLAVQNGQDRRGQDNLDGTFRYLRCLRDLASYVHVDALHEAYFNAALIMAGKEQQAKAAEGNPYTAMGRRQEGFGTFGGPHLLVLLTEVATRALKAVWFQKWFVHRRLRPEAMAGRVELALNQAGTFGNMVANEVKNSNAVAKIKAANGTALLPAAFPEGSPTHPSYGAGHATVAGACVTILKAWFDTTKAISNPVRPSDDGTILLPSSDMLTFRTELRKLAANIAIGRNAGAVHYRTDYTKSLALGEAVAIAILQEHSLMCKEEHEWNIDTFSGDSIKIKNGVVTRSTPTSPLIAHVNTQTVKFHST